MSLKGIVSHIRRLFWRLEAASMVSRLCWHWSAEQRAAYLRDLEAAYFTDFRSASSAIEEDRQYWGEGL